MIPPREQLPKSWQGLKQCTFDLPTLFPNVSWTCPTKQQEILEYLNVEARGGSQSGSENIIAFDLKFVRTANVNDSKYWLWSFPDGDGVDCFVAVRQDEAGETVLGFEEALGLTPEQWLVMDYYEDREDA